MRRLILLTALALAAGGCIETAQAPLAPDADEATPDRDGRDRQPEPEADPSRGARDPQPEPEPEPAPAPAPEPDPGPEPGPAPDPASGLERCPEGWGVHVNRDYCVDGYGCEQLDEATWCYEPAACAVGEPAFHDGPYCLVAEADASVPGFECGDAYPELFVAGPFVACGRGGEEWARRLVAHEAAHSATWSGRCAEVDGVEIRGCGGRDDCQASWCVAPGVCPEGAGMVSACHPRLEALPEAVAAQQCFLVGRRFCEVGAEDLPPDGSRCRQVCAGEGAGGCWDTCETLRGRLRSGPFHEWATCTVNTVGRTWEGRAGACAAQLTCDAPEPLVGQHCDALARCSAEGRGWYDEAECRAAPPGDADHWACLTDAAQAELQGCFQLATCNDMAWCLDVAVCNGDMTCARVWAAEWQVP